VEPSCPIVVAFDFGHAGRLALDRALTVAQRAPWHVLHVVCVIDPHMPFPALPADRIDARYEERVRETIAGMIGDQARFLVHVRVGSKPARHILQVASEVGAELIMVGCHGLTGVERFLVGSISERVVREARCTVEVVRDSTYARS
jgi:nucleotide-binding universal stress UspA family protein